MSDDLSDSQYANPPTPPELRKRYDAGRRNLLPAKSGGLYTKSYDNFVKWQEKHNTNSASTRVLLSYFIELSETRAPTTLWSEFSKLKSTLQLYQGVDIGSYSELIAFLKKMSKGYQCKKAPAFTGLQVEDFLVNACDSQYLFEKTALVIGLLGACRKEELMNIKTADMELYYADYDRFGTNPMILATIPKSKNGESRSSIIKGGFYQIVRRYSNLRPKDVGHDRFFINYQGGKCTKQAVGINKMGSVPNTVAKFLGLDKPERYTSHTIRHTAASLFVEGGGCMEDLKRLGGWKSDAAASGYVTHSKSSKIKICDKITSAIKLGGFSSASTLTASASTESTSSASASTASASTASAPPTSTSTPSWPKASSTKANSRTNSGSTSNDSLAEASCNSIKSSLVDLQVPVTNKENAGPLNNQILGQELKLHISNCTNITFNISKTNDS